MNVRERGIIAEWLMEKYDASAADFMYQQFARNAKQVTSWQEDLDRDRIPADFAAMRVDIREVRMVVEAQALNVLKQAEKLVPFELAAKKSIEHKGAVEINHGAIDAPPAAKDWNEWKERHGVDPAERPATTRH